MSERVAQQGLSKQRELSGADSLRQLIARLPGGLSRRVTDRIDRGLHARRRRSAHLRIAGALPIRSVLFLCHGNICRSSYAEFAFRRLARERGIELSVRSAGFVGPGRQPPEAALAVARRRGLDMSGHRSRLLSQAMLDSADCVVVMTADQAAGVAHRLRRGALLVLGDVDPLPIVKRTIHDPWRGDERVFETTYDRIDRCLGELAGLISGQGPGVE